MQKAKRQIRRLVRNAAKDYGLGWRVPRAYRHAARSAVDPRKVLFLEATLAEMPEAFKAMYARVQADPRFDASYVSLGKYRVDAATYLRNCEAFAREAATAAIIFLNDASDVVSSLPLRPETRVVQLWHACGAFKRFGMSTAEAGYGLSRADIERHPFYENLSLVTVSSSNIEWAYVEAMNLAGREGVVQALGVSRTDLFFDEAFHEQALWHLFEQVPAAVGKRVVLYAPTYRGDLSNARAPEPPDFVELKRALGEDAVVLVKQHPMVRERSPIPAEAAGFAFDVTDELPIDELLVAAQVLVTDYSSVVFEFSLFNRPMVFYAPDLDDYVRDRDFYYDFNDMTPGPVVATTAALAASLVQAIAGPADEQVGAFRRFFMGACDGHATERILDAVVDGRVATAPRTPRRLEGAALALRRPHVFALRLACNAGYRLFDRAQRRNEAVFISRQSDRPSYDFTALAREFEERGWKATMHLKAVTKRNFVSYARHIIVEIWLLGRCKVAIVDRYDPIVCLIDFASAGPSAQSEVPLTAVNLQAPVKPVVLQLWHAFGSFKKFGYQSVGTPEAHPADVFRDYRIHRNYSWVVCSGEQSRAAFAEAFSCPCDRVVALNRPEFNELVALRRSLAAAGEDAPARPRVLMAPTRRFDEQAQHPFRDLYGHREQFERAIPADVVWAFHPLDAGLPAPGNVSDNLVNCDVLVTDYSSIVYEAYVLGKPVLFYVPDIEYYREVPGLNCDPLQLAPDLCFTDDEELAQRVAALIADPQDYPVAQYEQFAARAFDYTIEQLDGAAIPSMAAGIVDFLFDRM